MATFTIKVGNLTMEQMDCISCGNYYAIRKDVADHARERGGYHYCPYCRCSQGWDGKTRDEERAAEIASLKARILDSQERERRARQDAEHFEASRNDYKGQVTKLKNRAAAGMCPCCNRHFTNLERHINTKHPDFKETAE